MRRPAKIRLAGTIAAIPLFVAAATSAAFAQSLGGDFLNDQVNDEDIFANQRLNVVTVVEGARIATDAQGNVVDIGGEGVDVRATSNQVNAFEIRGQSRLEVSGSAGASSRVATTAVGNSGVAEAVGATYSGFMVQTNSGPVTAIGKVEADGAHANDLGLATQAAGNAQALLLTNGAAGARISQANSGNVLADGGAAIGHVTGSVDVAGSASGNSVDIVGDDQSAARVIVDQGNTAAQVQASQFTTYANSYLTTTTANAAGNSLSADNTGPLLDVANHQYNTAYVRAQAEGTSYQFGAAQSSAYGVGNAAAVGNLGAALVLDNVQMNDGGGVEVIASAGGHEGYDIGASATASGNSVSGYACGTCGASMTTTNSQTNNAEVSARATTTVTGSARSISGVATATGNNASFRIRSN